MDPVFFNQPLFKTHLYVNGGFQIFTGKHKNYLKVYEIGTLKIKKDYYKYLVNGTRVTKLV